MKFRSVILIVLCVVLLLPSLCSCANEEKYPMRASTKEDQATILTMGEHQVPFELFRAFFLARTEALDDSLTWEEKWAEAMPRTLDDLAYVYAIFSLCEKYDIDPYGDKVDKLLAKRIKISIEGGKIDGVTVNGYGTYQAYIDSLTERHLTDRAARILLRYQICEERLLSLLTRPYQSKYEYDEDDIRAFYESDDCRLALLLYREKNDPWLTPDESKTLVENGLEKLLLATTEEERISFSVQYFNNSTSEIENGTLISPYAFSHQVGGELLGAAFGLEVGEYSDVLTVNTMSGDYFYVVYAMEKNNADYKQRAEEAEDLYLRDTFYRELETKKEELKQQVVYQDLYQDKLNSEIRYGS